MNYCGTFNEKKAQEFRQIQQWYDPVSGRYNSQNLVGPEAEDTNVYEYCGNSPTDADEEETYFVNFEEQGEGRHPGGLRAEIYLKDYHYQKGVGRIAKWHFTGPDKREKSRTWPELPHTWPR